MCGDPKTFSQYYKHVCSRGHARALSIFFFFVLLLCCHRETLQLQTFHYIIQLIATFFESMVLNKKLAMDARQWGERLVSLFTNLQYLHVRRYIIMYIHTYIRTYVHTYIHTYIRTYVHTYIHIHVHVCMLV